ncbi:putative ABC transporter substrate-binding protein [Gordonia soli NBRC 108243]|uniref:Putative ABC transporter substrate-binding protein n=1 Tax=Gordonia soli NBRC 108243 TaxID=1223545 RepID=M0QQ04_9ACTN|nr:putative ABC transporter substrate-binding protein [Gordonia soli NBRC 108243]
MAAAAIGVAIPLVSACGSGYTPRTLNIYPPADGASFIDKVGKQCTADSNGEYKIVTTPLPKAADDQRLQLARRLAGNDPGLDLMGMDVVWTAEFADAGWIQPVPEALAAKVAATSLGGPRETAMWKTADDTEKRLYAIPTWTNTQLLWYRPDLQRKYLNTSKAPTTWDELLAQTQEIRAKGGPSYIMVQGKQYEGLMVWFNSVLASAGGSVVGADDPNRVTLNDTPEHRAATVKALQILKAVATAPGHDPSLTNSDESSARLGMENGSAAFEVNWPFVFSSMRSNAAAGDVPFFPEMQQFAGLLAEDSENPPTDAQLGPVNKVVRTKFNFARYPGVNRSLPAKTTLGGINIAVASTSKQKDLAFKAADCLTNEAAQKVYSVEGGTPPTIEAIYDDPDFRAAYPMGQDIRAQLETESSALRPASPVYQAISTLLTAKLSPVGAWDPETLVDQLADQVRKAIDGEGLIP